MSILGAWSDAVLSINSVALTTRAKNIALTYSAAALDASAMSNTTKVNLAGLLEWSLTLDLIQDYAASGAGSVDATLFALIGAAAFAIALKITSSAISTTNPEYQGNAILVSYQPASGRHGDLLMSNATFACASALVRDTTP